MGRILRSSRPEGALATSAGTRSARALTARQSLTKTALVATGVGVLAASAWVSIPFYPVPMTMQTLAVLLVAGFLGPRLGVAAVTSYIALGLAGAPVFHNGLGGLAVLAGPTGGYLMGFVPATFLMGLASRKGWTAPIGPTGVFRRVVQLTSGALLAQAAIYCLGLTWLAFVTTTDARTALSVGLFPFLLGDLVKTAVVVTGVRSGNDLLARRGMLPF